MARSAVTRDWRRLWRCLLLLPLMLLISPLQAQWPGSWQFTVSQLRSQHFALEGLRLRQADEGFQFELGRFQFGALEWSQLALRCAHGRIDLQHIRCPQGQLQIVGQRLPLELSFDLQLANEQLALELRPHAGGHLRLSRQGDELQLSLETLSLASLEELLGLALPPALADVLTSVQHWQPQALIDGQLRWQAGGQSPQLSAQLRLSEAQFGSADGLQAGEQLALQLNFEASVAAGNWHWRADAEWLQGALYIHPLYLEAGVRLQASGQASAAGLEITLAELELEGIEQLALSGRFALQPLRIDELAFSLANADLALIGPRWLTPLLAPELSERVRYAGHAGAAIALRDGKLQRIDATFDGAGISLQLPPTAGAQATGWSFGPLDGHLPWRADQATQASLQIDGGRWGALSLGAFELIGSVSPQRLAFAPIRIPLLDGALLIDALALQVDLEDPARSWRGEGSVVVEPLSMSALSSALGWPQFGGRLSASLPGMQIDGDEIRFGGALVVSLFDGYLQATELRVREAFGVASQLSANVEARHLDLAQLTDTFSFGSISGFIDFDIGGLELLRWSPVAFDFRLASTPGSGGGRISQRAVQNISALGGGGALAAMQRGVLSLFDTFGYRSLGLSCVLRDGVCAMGGITAPSADQDSFVIVRGGGIPALDVIGYNSRVDWNELLDRLQRVLEDKLEAEIR